MIELIPYFAGLITVLFGVGFFLALKKSPPPQIFQTKYNSKNYTQSCFNFL